MVAVLFCFENRILKKFKKWKFTSTSYQILNMHMKRNIMTKKQDGLKARQIIYENFFINVKKKKTDCRTNIFSTSSQKIELLN